jgi:uncharacterized protein YqjF (DUF2071 family)
VQTQVWNYLLFAHWPVDPAVLRPLIPAGLEIDTFAAQAWVGIVPFWITRLRGRGLPAVPGTANFNEINVRTYVRGGGKAGVWFFSLDADNVLAVIGARLLFHLPYFNAQITHALGTDQVAYVSRRVHPRAPSATFHGTYGPRGAAFTPEVGSLEYWLTARYRLFSQDRAGRLYRAEIRHAPWSLQPGWAEIHQNTMAAAHGIALPDTPPLLHYSRMLRAYFWPLERLSRPADTG